MDIEYKKSFSCSINEHFSVKTQRILIRLGSIEGYGNGDKHSNLIAPSQSCFVVKDKDIYRLINSQNPRVNALLSAFNSESKVECLLIDEKREEELAFLENELLLQQSSSVTFKRFIQDLASSIKKQQFVLKFFCSEPSRKDASFLFNVSTFLGLMGANAPSRQSILNYLNPPKNKAKEKKEKAITTPNQVTNMPKFKSRNFTEKPKDYYNDQFDISFDLREMWNKYGSKAYKIDEIISRLRKERVKTQETFINRLQLDKDSPEFKEFIDKFIDFMNTKKHD